MTSTETEIVVPIHQHEDAKVAAERIARQRDPEFRGNLAAAIGEYEGDIAHDIATLTQRLFEGGTFFDVNAGALVHDTLVAVDAMIKAARRSVEAMRLVSEVVTK